MSSPREDDLPTAHELRVLVHVATLGTYAEAARELGMTHRAIAACLENTRSRLDARSTIHAYSLALARGLVQPPRRADLP